MVNHPVLSAALFVGWISATVVSHLGAGDYLVIIGAAAFAVASLRTGRMKVLRDTNTDLSDRNAQLEAEKIEMVATIVKLEGEPNLKEHQAVLEALVHSLKEHDSRTQLATSESQRIFAQMLAELKDIKVAVVPPAGLRD